ncbi:MAG: hypothetical protein HY290_11570 [Planctomycetia bacterium]|nr:hypothetical protein [Planctomycetia bacterium]
MDALELVSRGLSADSERFDYEPHYASAWNMLARWQGGDSEDRLRAAVAIELTGYQANPPPGRQAKVVGAAFGAVCRAVGVK